MNSTELLVSLVPKPDRRESLLEQMRNEWSQAPGLRMSPQEIQTRWQLESSTCSQLLSVLVDLEVLARDADGNYTTMS